MNQLTRITSLSLFLRTDATAARHHGVLYPSNCAFIPSRNLVTFQDTARFASRA